MKDVCLGAKLSLNSGRGYVQVIEALNGVNLVKDRINSAMNLLTVLDIDTVW